MLAQTIPFYSPPERFLALRPGANDRFESLNPEQLLAELGKHTAQPFEDIKTCIYWLWWDFNSESLKGSKPRWFLLGDEDFFEIIRWVLRGLSVAAATRKVRVDMEMSSCSSQRRDATPDLDHTP